MGGAVATILGLCLQTILYNKSLEDGRDIPTINVDTFNPGTSFVENYELIRLKEVLKSYRLNFNIRNFIFRQDPISRANLFGAYSLMSYCLVKYPEKLESIRSASSTSEETKLEPNYRPLLYNSNTNGGSLRGGGPESDIPDTPFEYYKEILDILSNPKDTEIRKQREQMKTIIFYVDDDNDIYNFLEKDSEKCFCGYKGFNSIFFSPNAIDDHYMINFPNIDIRPQLGPIDVHPMSNFPNTNIRHQLRPLAKPEPPWKSRSLTSTGNGNSKKKKKYN